MLETKLFIPCAWKRNGYARSDKTVSIIEAAGVLMSWHATYVRLACLHS